MKTEVKKIDANKREVNIQISGELVRNKFDEVFKRLAKDAKVRGFRPGHVPQDILEKNYSSTAHELVLKELVPDTYNQAIKKEGLDVIDLPNISEVKLDRDSLSFKATVEITPQIDIKNYKCLKVSYKKVEVTPDEIKRSVDALKETRKLDSVDDSFARSLGYPSLADLERAVERQIFIQKDNLQYQKIENEIVENITKDLDFKLPQVLVNRQLQDLVRQAELHLAQKGLSAEELKEQEKRLYTELEPQAKRQVKVYLVLAEIAKRENIPVDDHMPRKVIEFLLREADWKEPV